MKYGRAMTLLALAPLAAYGHSGEALEPHDLWQAWSFDPGIVVPLAIVGFLYARGARRSRGVSISSLACFWSGWIFLVLSLISPLHPLGEVLFSAHMAQHEVIMLVAAPLMVVSRPLAPILWGFPFVTRKTLGRWSKATAVQRIWRVVTQPLTTWWVHGATLWLWHVPRLFQATLESDWIHSAQHLSFFGSALLFWWSLFYAHGRQSWGASVLYIFTTAVHTSVLGALLTFARTVWYPVYSSTTNAWGLTALEDQQLGGLIMWIPAGLIYVGVGLAMFAIWLRESDSMTNRREYA